MSELASKKSIIDTLARSLARSEIASLVDVSTLTGIMSSGFNDMYRGGVVNLEMLWKILLNQEGVTEEMAALPLLMFEAAGEGMGVEVELPADLKANPELLKFQEAARRLELDQGPLRIGSDDAIPQSAAELIDAKRRADAEKGEAYARKLRRESGTETASDIADDIKDHGVGEVQQPPAPPSRTKILVLATIAVLSFIGAGVGTYLMLDTQAVPFDVSAYVGTLSIHNAVRDGDGASAVIADPRWIKMKTKEREQVIRDLFDQMKKEGLRGVVLKTPDGKIAGSAILTDRGVTIRVY